MCKRFLLSILFFTSAMRCIPHLDMQLGFGPAWHRYGFEQLFSFSLGGALSNVGSELKSDYALMPYVQGYAQFFFNDYCKISCAVGTGRLKRGSATTTELFSQSLQEPIFSRLVPVLLSSRICSSVIISDFCVGGKLPINDRICIIPIAGYAYNEQDPKITCLVTTITYDFKNKWQGPLIGGELAVRLSPEICLAAWYKLVFARFRSQLVLTQKTPLEEQGELLFFSNSTYSTSCASGYGNIFNVTLSYTPSNSLELGTGLSFLQYKNNRQGPVNLGKYNITAPGITEAELGVTGACINVMWQQIMWTFNCGICF